MKTIKFFLALGLIGVIAVLLLTSITTNTTPEDMLATPAVTSKKAVPIKKYSFREWNQIRKDTYILFDSNRECVVQKEYGQFVGRGYYLPDDAILSDEFKVTLRGQRFHEFCKQYVSKLPIEVQKLMNGV